LNFSFYISFFFCLTLVTYGGVERFLTPISIDQGSNIISEQKSAFLRGSFTNLQSDLVKHENSSTNLDSNAIQKMLSEAIKHRYQASGEISVQLSSEWLPLKASNQVVLKIKDASPDELSSSTFIRFSLWEAGQQMGLFSLPIRVSQLQDVYVTARSVTRGSKLWSTDFKLQRADVLKHHANTVPSSTNLSSFELDTNLQPNTPLKWNHLSKTNLIRKGQVIDVYASGKGIYVTMKGLALEDGHMDSLVKVRNLSSDKEFHAKVLSENSVKVSL
jgi:flagella basal body P-ring formation protein FlgA